MQINQTSYWLPKWGEEGSAVYLECMLMQWEKEREQEEEESRDRQDKTNKRSSAGETAPGFRIVGEDEQNEDR